VSCVLCETRKPRRYCPGVRGDICSLCCGAEREVSVDCPFDCEYLREARLHDKPKDVSLDDFPNRDVEVTEEFLRKNDSLVVFASMSLMQAALEAQGAVDTDAREAIEAMIRTHRTLDTGLIYETRPSNPYASAIQQGFQTRLEQLRQRLLEQSGMHTLRDTDVLGVLIFLQRMEIQHNNGRRRGRAFLDFLRGYFDREQASSLIVPAGS